MPALMRISERTSILQKILQPCVRFVALTLMFFTIIAVLRAYEFIAVGASHALPEKPIRYLLLGVGVDFMVVTIVAGIFVIPYLVLSLVKQRMAVILYGSVLLLLSIVDVSLLQYFAVTYTPLGADLFGYSWHDITLTINSSGGFSLFTLIPFVLVAALTIGAVVFSGNIKLPITVTMGFVLLVLVSLIVVPWLMPSPGDFTSEAEYNLTTSKLGFFTSKTFSYLTRSQADGDDLPAEAYPLLRDIVYDDVLGPYFETGSKKPNFVFVIVEGLGRSFVGDGAELGGFTPFLDSLTHRSLYWENFLSTSGRTFAALPSLFGSLPFGESGFMEMGYKMPSHLSLIRLLKEQGYFTSYYYGSNANFDLQDVFLERQQLDFLLDEYQFGPSYGKAEADANGYSWGYADGDLFKRSFEVIDEKRKDPRLDIYLTISTHEPFLPPHKEHYFQEFDERLDRLSVGQRKKETYRKYRQEFSSLLYTDDAVRYLITEYQRRPEYDNTIFIITGDHRIIPIPTETRIDRFHVPFIIFSKMLKRPQCFSSVSSHADVTPSILAFLQRRCGIQPPQKAHWLGTGIDTAAGFRNIHSIALMKTKEELSDFVEHEYFLSGEQLFRLKAGLVPEEVDDLNMKSLLAQKLRDIKRINRYVCRNNKLYPEQADQARSAPLAADDSAVVALDALKLNSDQLFQLARDKAAANDYEGARAICRKLLRNGPNFHDVRTLLGRTYSWERRYDEARTTFSEVMRRAPNYPDAQLALADVEYWTGNNERVLELVGEALQKFPSNQSFLVCKVKALSALGRKNEAQSAFNQLLKLNPTSAEASALRKQLGL